MAAKYRITSGTWTHGHEEQMRMVPAMHEGKIVQVPMPTGFFKSKISKTGDVIELDHEDAQTGLREGVIELIK